MAEHEELIEFLQSRAGNALRAVGRYNDDTCRLTYLRDGLPREETRDRLDALRANITWAWNPPSQPTIDQLGTKEASLQIREQAIILHIPLDTGWNPDRSRSRGRSESHIVHY
jgi:hypothetical protein